MANRDAPRGLIPVRYLNGRPYNGATNRYHVPASDGTIIGIGDPVVLTGSADSDGIPTVTRATAGSGTITGVVVSVEVASETSVDLENKHRAASTLAYLNVADDPDLVFEIQEDSDTENMVVGDVGEFCDLATIADADTTTGRSTVELDSSNAGTGDQMRIVGLVQRPDNALGTNAKWLVTINEHTLKAVSTPI